MAEAAGISSQLVLELPAQERGLQAPRLLAYSVQGGDVEEHNKNGNIQQSPFEHPDVNSGFIWQELLRAGAYERPDVERIAHRKVGGDRSDRSCGGEASGLHKESRRRAWVHQ